MSIRTLLLAVGALALLGAGVALAQMGGGMMGGGMMGQGMMGSERHYAYMHYGPPPAYAGKTDPLPETAAVLAEGRKLYQANCAACHGTEGRGDGPMAATLNPPPPDLAQTLSMPIARDDFLDWTIAEGGARFASHMPAFKSTLSSEQIWSIVTALRSGDLEGK